MHNVRISLAMLMLTAWIAPTYAGDTYLPLREPQAISWPAQHWEGDQQPHTLSVLELNRGGYRYWGWYGLNHGRGVGLARSNDLLHWRKFAGNPLSLNARWPSALLDADPGKPRRLYFALTRDYDTTSSRIVLAISEDGVHLTDVGDLVAGAPNQRNQNPNLFHDPVTGRYFLTFYRGDDTSHFAILSKSARTIGELAAAPEKELMVSSDTIAAPNLMYVPPAGPNAAGLYYMTLEIFPSRYDKTDPGVWQVEAFAATQADGPFHPVDDNPIQDGGRACLFQHVFDGLFYGFQCRLEAHSEIWSMEVLTSARRLTPRTDRP